MRPALFFYLATLWSCAAATEAVSEVEAPRATREAAAPAAEAAPPAASTNEAEPEPEPEATPAPRAYVPLTEEKVRDTVRVHYDRVGACYAAGLERDPTLAGTIEVHLSIGDDGKVVSAFADKDDAAGAKPDARKGKPKRRKPSDEPRITDAEVVGCVEGVFASLTFPPTGRGLVNLVYPVVLRTE